ncbi:hypothetical protein M5D10_13350 [Leptospira santarosai]|uniref:hypothetical protein n=1 Tax=Leptospira santarosai TaxID=28183 RepID=UPI0022A98135|nr:hypothetical protein [Leptospira santarosai]UZN06785.1 hypothetical protein M5D10_13350 [Leptospira santarosai]
MAPSNYGHIFEAITQESLPNSVLTSWEVIVKKKKITGTIVKESGSNLTPMRGNVFRIEKLNTDIDKFL